LPHRAFLRFAASVLGPCVLESPSPLDKITCVDKNQLSYSTARSTPGGVCVKVRHGATQQGQATVRRASRRRGG
jgi:hypothetical protein